MQTERELVAALYAQGLPRGERSHLPDGVLCMDNRVVALEVELTGKSATRLQSIFRQYAPAIGNIPKSGIMRLRRSFVALLKRLMTYRLCRCFRFLLQLTRLKCHNPDRLPIR